jgi:hypothetical protein
VIVPGKGGSVRAFRDIERLGHRAPPYARLTRSGGNG